MKIIDYYFYRFYILSVRHNTQDEILRSSILASINFVALYGFSISAVLKLYDGGNHFKFVAYTSTIILYLRYRKKHKKIISKFEGNHFDKYLPYVLLCIFMPVLLVVGAFVGFRLEDLFVHFNMIGIVSRWFAGLF